MIYLMKNNQGTRRPWRTIRWWLWTSWNATSTISWWQGWLHGTGEYEGTWVQRTTWLHGERWKISTAGTSRRRVAEQRPTTWAHGRWFFQFDSYLNTCGIRKMQKCAEKHQTFAHPRSQLFLILTSHDTLVHFI